jgi:hypothetical protein
MSVWGFMIRGKGFIFAAIILAVDFFALVTALSFFFTPIVTARTIENNFEEINIEESIEFAPASETHNIIKFNIFEDIAKARELLEKSRCGFRTIRLKKGKKIELGEFTVLLAVEDIRTREILVVRAHPRRGGLTKTIVVEPGKSNGVNTKFTVTYPENNIVLAIKRPVRHGTSFKEVTYTPYSEGLDIPEVREAGLKYLRSVLTTAKNDLTKRGAVSSWETFFADDISVVLAIIEHIDPVSFESGKYSTERLINETLVVLGANKQKAYRFSTSEAGARGLFQFIPKTYKRIVDRYPQAGLDKDFTRGMEDHKNAAKAALLLFDADFRIMNHGRTNHITDDPWEIGRLLASAYNCGSGKTKGAFEKHGDRWNSKVPTETQIYLKKFDAVWEWLHIHSQTVHSITIRGRENL